MKKVSVHQEALAELVQFHDKHTDVRPYELTAISTNLSDTEIADFLDRVKKIFATHGAEVKSEAAPMRARLSYPIRKIQQGVYFFIRFSVIPGKVKEITRDLSLMPEMLRPHIDALSLHEGKKAAAAPVGTMSTEKAAKGWTKREDVGVNVEEKPADAAIPVVEAKVEDKATIEDLDKRLGEILGKSN